MAGVFQRLTLDEFADETGAAAEALRRETPALLKLWAVAARADALQNFDRGATPDDEPWRRLAFPRARGGDRPLRDTGLLAASLQGGANHVERYEAASVTIGTNRVGAKLMQEGGTVTPKGHPFLSIPKTREAARYSSPRQFPRALLCLIGKKGGVLVEPPKTPRAVAVVQYALARSVTVPARRFVGVGKRLIAKIHRITIDFAERVRKRGRG